MSLLKKFGYLLLDQTETEGPTFDLIITSLLELYIIFILYEKQLFKFKILVPIWIFKRENRWLQFDSL